MTKDASETLGNRGNPGVIRRLAGRFALLAFGLYHIPLLLNDYPSLGGGGGGRDGIAVSWGHVFGHVGLWVAHHVFHMTGPMPNALDGDNGDTAEEYGRLLVTVVVAAVAAAIWAFADRRRPGARWVENALHVLLRYALALGLASYGMAKIYPTQFGPISATGLERRVGELSPGALLWVFMEYSRVYCTFAGVMEMLAVVLLCFRRTATLGALVCLGTMTNVMLMNLCFHFDVKLYSTAMVASAAVLVLYDARYLARVLVLRRATPSRPIRPPFRSRRLNQARWWVKLVFVGGVIWSSSIDQREILARRALDEASPLSGGWEVASLVVNGRELARTAEPSRWRRVMVSQGWFTIRLEDEALVYCTSAAEDLARIVILTCDTRQEGVLRWTRSGDQLRLEGTFDHAAVRASLQRRDEAALPLRKSRFQWTTDG